MAPTFQIRDSFHLTGRGLVAIGEILSGNIEVGDHVIVDIEGVQQNLVIGGVEFVDQKMGEITFIGLILNGLSELDFSSIKLKRQIVSVLKK